MPKAPTIDLSSLSYKQLTDLEIKIANLKPRLQEAEKASLREKLAKMAEQSGYRLEAVLAATPKRRSRNKARARSRGRGMPVPVKYRNPKNASETWSGRGRPARWLQALIDSGRKREEFAVN